jgi:hypothetical protein
VEKEEQAAPAQEVHTAIQQRKNHADLVAQTAAAEKSCVLGGALDAVPTTVGCQSTHCVTMCRVPRPSLCTASEPIVNVMSSIDSDPTHPGNAHYYSQENCVTRALLRQKRGCVGPKLSRCSGFRGAIQRKTKVQSIDISLAGVLVVETLQKDNNIYMWYLRSGAEQRPFNCGIQPRDAKFTVSCFTMASGHVDDAVRVWGVERGELRLVLRRAPVLPISDCVVMHVDIRHVDMSCANGIWATSVSRTPPRAYWTGGGVWNNGFSASVAYDVNDVQSCDDTIAAVTSDGRLNLWTVGSFGMDAEPQRPTMADGRTPPDWMHPELSMTAGFVDGGPVSAFVFGPTGTVVLACGVCVVQLSVRLEVMRSFSTVNELVNKVIYVLTDNTFAVQTAASIFCGFGGDITDLVKTNYKRPKALLRTHLLKTGSGVAKLTDCSEVAYFNSIGASHVVFSRENVVEVWLFRAEEEE